MDEFDDYRAKCSDQSEEIIDLKMQLYELRKRAEIDDAFLELAKWIIDKKCSVFFDADIPMEYKRKILHKFNYSSNMLYGSE
jgi:hypothetical protein